MRPNNMKRNNNSKRNFNVEQHKRRLFFFFYFRAQSQVTFWKCQNVCVRIYGRKIPTYSTYKQCCQVFLNANVIAEDAELQTERSRTLRFQALPESSAPLATKITNLTHSFRENYRLTELRVSTEQFYVSNSSLDDKKGIKE